MLLDRKKWKASVARLKEIARRATKPPKPSKQRSQSDRSGIKARSRFTFHPKKSQHAEAAHLDDDNPFKTAKIQCKLVKKGNAVYTFAPPAKRSKTKTAPKKRKKQSDAKARSTYYNKLTAGADELTERIKFFEIKATTKATTTTTTTTTPTTITPTTTTAPILNTTTTQLNRPAVPTWVEAKKAVFSSSSSSYMDSSDTSDIPDAHDSVSNDLWAAPAPTSTYNHDDDKDLWATPAPIPSECTLTSDNPSECTPTPSDNSFECSLTPSDYPFVCNLSPIKPPTTTLQPQPYP